MHAAQTGHGIRSAREVHCFEVLILSQILPHSPDDMPSIHTQKSPKVNPCFIDSNVYSDSERLLLSWLNTNYENARHIVWKKCPKGIPSERWILNFDKHLSDGLVFATVLGAYCPFLVEPYFMNMYTQPKGPEQYFHNCAIVVDSLREIGFSIGIQACDICDYNPILMLMLCVYMYERLPTYLPKMLVTFQCSLHDTAKRKVLVKNSSSKRLVYNATIIGRDAADFTLSPTESTVTVPPNDSENDSEQDTAPKTLKTSIRSSFIREFFCPSPTVHLKAGPKGTSSLELFFVPFDMQIRYCIIILSNKMIGELVYIVEGKELDEDNPVLYLKCKPCHTLDTDLILPLTNEVKEKALAFAAQQQMSDVEYQRRLLTGTLESSSIRVAIAILGLTRVEVNRTMNDWRCHMHIEGECFYGPRDFSVKQGETAQYPLTFKPLLECEVMGKLTVQNKADGMEHVFAMKGIGRRPVALDSITAHCQVGIPEDRTIMVPNHTKSRITFKVSSNVPIVWGKQSITIEPGSAIPYILHISSWKRGVFKGKLSFSIENSQDGDFEKDSDEDQGQHEIQHQDGRSFFKKLSEKSIKLDTAGLDDDDSTIQVWYNLEIHIYPGKPVNIIEIKCVAMETTCFEIPLRNAKEITLQIEVLLSSPALSGIKKFVLNPEECIDYAVCYTPAATGCREEKFIIQNFPLTNPTHETLELQVRNSNPDNFFLDSQKLLLTMAPLSTERIRVRFCPSALGRAGQQATLTFYCAQFEEWKFLLSGIGLFPQPLEIERITTYLQQLASLAIIFKNPTDEHVLIDVILTNREMPKNLALGIQCDSFLIETTAFKLSMERSHGIELPPRGNIPITVCFNPKVMKLRKTMAVVQMRRADGTKWPIDNFDELSPELKRMMVADSGEMQAIRWIYPILGLPQAKHDEFPPVVIKCQSRKRIEKNLKVTITGDFIGDHPILNVSDFVVIPKKRSYASYEDIDGIPIKREFEYEILYESDEVRVDLQPSVAVYLMKRSYNIKTQVITLDFNVIFSPKKPMKSQIILKIECITDGIWNFPVTLIATEPEVDDVINIEGKGLFKEAVTEFWLSGRKRYTDDFVAYFLPDSDPEFFVKPESGEIPPFDSNGITLLVGFKPQMYGRKYKARLVIQTADMYYLYAVNGLPQNTKPPKNVKPKIDATNKNFDDRTVTQHNFIKENNKMCRCGGRRGSCHHHCTRQP
ncbi:hypothetical protein D623_10008657 [Myotis brandtii]|uniref:Calponin-homology (CH) domain-containing protein n=1 Tax=Myotis brandtii TaxID=109478 RepID=S7PWT2_MYOBR|nr:hypothetical protein D623_10008657 [Myotis brandtii]